MVARAENKSCLGGDTGVDSAEVELELGSSQGHDWRPRSNVDCLALVRTKNVVSVEHAISRLASREEQEKSGISGLVGNAWSVHLRHPSATASPLNSS